MEKEKIAQAVDILRELDVDLWLVVDRESGLMTDPVMDYVVGSEVTWLSLFLFFRSGDTAAIVGNLDIEKIERKGLFSQVLAYKGSPREQLRGLLDRFRPRRIALDYSLDSAPADGISHGCYLSLLELLKGTEYASLLESAEPIISRLRGRKSPEEIRRLCLAVDHTEDILKRVGKWAAPGMTERELASRILEAARKKKLRPAWGEEHCPSVFFGPQKVGAHSGPTDVRLQKGHVFNIDFGLKFDKYCSDLQRTWYVMKDGETEVPRDVQRAFETIVSSIDQAFMALKPGAKGIDVDGVARRAITTAGYEEYAHALGHQVGRNAHDGVALLAPAWERYGNLPYMPLEAGQVYTLEPRIKLDDYGVVTVEEMVTITLDGARYLSHPQKELWIVK